MPTEFRRHIRKSLSDSNLQTALDASSIRRVQVRKKGFASLPDVESRRQRAHSVRAEVIEHLAQYVEQFSTKAQENGMQIHLAANANEAVKCVLELAFHHRAKLIAKSKTMVGEEIRLNPALEERGLQAIETDLGEYIVQLRGEAPSHIITPAVHLMRQDVGRLFEQKLGLPYTEDIAIMTNAARQTLRQVFLKADIGVSGVNLGVAQTGTICLVTNEGNGRMVTTVPRVHIGLMGIERIVPTMDDLSLMLSLLPRSATGQKLSAYTSLITRPRQSDDPDGPQERHLILVDNGRRTVQHSSLREILYCIRCGACLNVCPVFRELGGHAYVSVDGKQSPYPGPVGSVLSPALFGQEEYGHLARASSLCGACREACPVDIDLPSLLLRVRAGIRADQADSFPKPNAPLALSAGLKLYSMAATSPRRFAAAQWLVGVLGTLAGLVSRDKTWIHLPGFTGWGLSKDFPRPARRSFRSRYDQRSSYPSNGDEIGTPLVKKSVDKPNVAQNALPPSAPKSEKFAAELTALGGNFIPCREEDVASKVLEILRQHQLDQVLTWDAPHLDASWLEMLTNAGIKLIQPSSENVETCRQVGAGLTGVSAGIADTGSLLLLEGPGKPLTASLLPPLHIAVMYMGDIYEDLDQVMRSIDISKSSSSVLITGPSRTSDIEMVLTIGVHGPGELYVLCISDSTR